MDQLTKSRAVTYPILQVDAIKVQPATMQAPIIGRWYCGMDVVTESDGSTYMRGGTIAQYVGEGQFYADGATDESDMNDYDFLAEQF